VQADTPSGHTEQPEDAPNGAEDESGATPTGDDAASGEPQTAPPAFTAAAPPPRSRGGRAGRRKPPRHRPAIGAAFGAAPSPWAKPARDAQAPADGSDPAQEAKPDSPQRKAHLAAMSVGRIAPEDPNASSASPIVEASAEDDASGAAGSAPPPASAAADGASEEDGSAAKAAFWSTMQSSGKEELSRHLKDKEPPKPKQAPGMLASIFGRRKDPLVDPDSDEEDEAQGPTLDPTMGPPRLPGMDAPSGEAAVPPGVNPFAATSGKRGRGKAKRINRFVASAPSGAGGPAPPSAGPPASTAMPPTAAAAPPKPMATFNPATFAPPPEQAEASHAGDATAESSIDAADLAQYFPTMDSVSQSFIYEGEDSGDDEY